MLQYVIELFILQFPYCNSITVTICLADKKHQHAAFQKTYAVFRLKFPNAVSRFIRGKGSLLIMEEKQLRATGQNEHQVNDCIASL